MLHYIYICLFIYIIVSDRSPLDATTKYTSGLSAWSSPPDPRSWSPKFSLDHDIFHGLVHSTNTYSFQAEEDIAKAIIDTGLWSILWHRLVQMLQVRNPDSNQPIHDIESADCPQPSSVYAPDFGLLSPQGLIASLQLATSVFTKVSQGENLFCFL